MFPRVSRLLDHLPCILLWLWRTFVKSYSAHALVEKRSVRSLDTSHSQLDGKRPKHARHAHFRPHFLLYKEKFPSPKCVWDVTGMGVESESKSICSSTVSPQFLLHILCTATEMCAKEEERVIPASVWNVRFAGIIPFQLRASIDNYLSYIDYSAI